MSSKMCNFKLSCVNCLQTLAFNNDGNLWVAGASGLSLMQIDPDTVGAAFNDGDIGPTILLTPGSTYVNLTAAQVSSKVAVGDLNQRF